MPLLWAGMELTTSFFTVKSAAARDMEVRADEVVDRQTLKTFVLQAKKYLESLKTVAEVVRLQEILTSTGYWKSGTMFLMIVNRDGVVLLHGGGQSIGWQGRE